MTLEYANAKRLADCIISSKQGSIPKSKSKQGKSVYKIRFMGKHILYQYRRTKKSRSEYLDMTFGMSYNHFDIWLGHKFYSIKINWYIDIQILFSRMRKEQ